MCENQRSLNGPYKWTCVKSMSRDHVAQCAGVEVGCNIFFALRIFTCMFGSSFSRDRLLNMRLSFPLCFDFILGGFQILRKTSSSRQGFNWLGERTWMGATLIEIEMSWDLIIEKLHPISGRRFFFPGEKSIGILHLAFERLVRIRKCSTTCWVFKYAPWLGFQNVMIWFPVSLLVNVSDANPHPGVFPCRPPAWVKGGD